MLRGWEQHARDSDPGGAPTPPGSFVERVNDRLRRARLGAQLLHQPRDRSAADVVRHLTGVQAQMLPAAELGLHVRSGGLTRARIERARLRDHSIVRTWAMRGTLHLIPSDDHAWLVPLLTEPRVGNARRRVAQEGVSPAQTDRALTLIEAMLTNGPMTRPEIADRLARRRVPVAGQAIAHLVWMSAARGAIVYGPDVGGETGFVLARDWLGAPAPPADRDTALRELAIRYLRAHGPAEPDDLAAWSGLGVRDAKRAWSLAADRLVPFRDAPELGWRLRGARITEPEGVVRLLPAFDDYLLGWRDRSFAVPPGRAGTVNRGGGMIRPTLVVDGTVAGTWTIDDGRLRLEPFGPLPRPVERRALAEAAEVERFRSDRA